MRLFKILLRKELITQLFGGGKSWKKDIVGKVVSALISLVFLALFVWLFVSFHSKFTQLNLEYEVLVIFLALGIIAQILFGIARTSKVLYGGADAKVILPLPITNFVMLASKLTALWIKDVINACFFIVPVFLAYGIMSGAGFWYYIFAILALALISVFTVSVAAIIAPLFVKIKGFFAKYPALILVLSLVFFVALIIVYSGLLSVISDMLIGDRLRFIFNTDTANALRKASRFLFFAKQVGDFVNGSFLGFVIILVAAAAALAGGYFISAHFYLTFLKSTTARQTKPAKTRKNTVRSENMTLVVKELTEIFKNPTYLFSYLSVLLTLPALCYLTIGVLSELIDKLLGGDFIVPFAVLILVMYSCVCNTFAGDVISREENRIMIVKTIPVSYVKQVGCKTLIALSIAFVADLLAVAVLLITGTLSFVETLLVFIVTVAETFASITHLVASDINHPSVGNGEENSNVSMAVVRALVVSVVFGVVCFVMRGADLFVGSTGNAFIKGLAGFTTAVGGVNGILLIIFAVCLLDLGWAAYRLVRKLDKRMREIKI